MCPTLRADIRLFARAAQIAGTSKVTIELQSNGEGDCSATISQIAEEMGRQFPQMAELIHASRWAVNNEFVIGDFPVSPGCCVALIPPVSGG